MTTAEEAIGDSLGQSCGLVRREYRVRCFGAVSGESQKKTKRLRRSPYSTRLNFLALAVDGSTPKTGRGVMIVCNRK